MNDISANLNSIAWWFSAVVVAIIVNLLSSYLRDATDRTWEYARRKLGQRGRDEQQRIAQSNAAFSDQLLVDELLRRFLFESELRARLLSIELFLTGAALVAMAVYLIDASSAPAWWRQLGRGMGFFSAVVIYYSLDRFAFADALNRTLLDVERRRSQRHGGNKWS